MRCLSFVLFFVFIQTISFGQTPYFYCLSVDEQGRTTMCFSSSFTNRTIYYYNTATSSYEVLKVQNATDDTNYTDLVNNAQLSSIEYKISSSGASSFARTIFLSSSIIDNSSIELSWNSPSLDENTPLQGTSGKKYKIERKKSSTNIWEEVYLTDSLHYKDVFSPICLDTLSYRIVLENEYGCFSSSNISKNIVKDDIIPSSPNILSLSCDETSQKLILSWMPSSSIDTKGYIICSGNPCVEIDRIYSKTQTSYVCNVCDITKENTLNVFAFDSCNNSSLNPLAHTNIVLELSHKDCSKYIDLLWNRYEGGNIEAISYNLYISENDGAFLLNKTFSNNETSYTFEANLNIEKYCFFIEAVLNNGERAKSNKRCFDGFKVDNISFAYIREASITEDNKAVELSFYLNSSFEAKQYLLYRSQNRVSYNLVANIENTNNDSFSFRDEFENSLLNQVYYYKLLVPDECNLNYYTSNIISTIFLKATQKEDGTNRLLWNNISGWEGVESYEVFRIDENNLDGLYLGALPFGDTIYEDNTELLFSVSDNLQYYILANEKENSFMDTPRGERSYTIKVRKPSLIFVPTAFTPNEVTNNVFKPSCSYINIEKYSFRVYNRWGELLFYTNDVEKGWDGYFKERLSPPASYIYVVEYVDSNGMKQKKTGAFNLIN
ncbi:MAG: gliding motility-associated C-terminal domain-containing protein [Bacteroidales bacterium]|jgi:gliding motility-associated-like protein|nr:gliding motility-associated C-terminal domain-containing protein [Bacteroidales bacterium]